MREPLSAAIGVPYRPAPQSVRTAEVTDLPQLVGLPHGLLIPIIVRRARGPYWVVVLAAVCAIVKPLGVTFLPQRAGAWIIPVGLGVMFSPTGLTTVSLRTHLRKLVRGPVIRTRFNAPGPATCSPSRSSSCALTIGLDGHRPWIRPNRREFPGPWLRSYWLIREAVWCVSLTGCAIHRFPGRSVRPSIRSVPVARDRWSATSEEGVNELGAFSELGGTAFHPELTAAEHVGAVGDLEDRLRALLHDEHGGSRSGELADVLLKD